MIQIIVALIIFNFSTVFANEDCSTFFQAMKCPEGSLITGPYEWDEKENDNFAVFFQKGTCTDLYSAAGLITDLGCKSSVKVCASIKTGKLEGPTYVCNDNKRIVLNFSDGSLDGSVKVYSSKMNILKQSEYANGKPVIPSKASRSIGSTKE